MKYLVDANVLSEPTHAQPAPHVVGWLARHEAELVVDPIILGELEFGILKLPPGKKRQALERWFAGIAAELTCLPLTSSVARTWAALLEQLRRRGTAMPLKDSLIAATALHHELRLVTRNAADFTFPGLEVVDPWLP